MALLPSREWKSCGDIRAVVDSDILQENTELKKTIEVQESQLTELHSVVAELRRKLETHQDNRIEEEEEEEEEEEIDNDDYFEDGIVDLVEAEAVSRLSNGRGGDGTAANSHQNKLCKILSHLTTIQREHADIREKLEDKEGELSKALGLLKKVRLEKEALVRKVHHLQTLVQTQPHSTTSPTLPPQTPQHCRYATRRKLPLQNPTHLTGPTLASIATSLNPSIVEKLINLNEAAMVGELASCSRAEVELVLEKEAVKVDKLQNEVDFLLGRLGEAKSANEELLAIVGKIESWGMGWKVVAERGDSTISLYDILVALLESELGLLLANVKAAGIGITTTTTEDRQESVESLLKRAEFNRDTAMGAAMRVLGNNKKMEKVGPRLLEHQIRSLIISLKTSSAHLLATIPTYDFNMKEEGEEMQIANLGRNYNNNNRMDLETAVLMQELLSCREEKADLKMRLVCVERERDFLGGLILDNQNSFIGKECNELNNNESSTPPPPLTPSLTNYSLLHSSNSSLLKSLEETKSKYRERVKLLEDRIVLLARK